MTPTITFQARPFVLDEPQPVSGDSGYRLNVFEPTGDGGKGARICQVPNFTWRSRAAVLELGTRIAALPVHEEALRLIAEAKEPLGYLAALGMQAYAREALSIAGLWKQGGDA